MVASGRFETDRRQAVATAKSYIDMAREVDAAFVRLFGGEIPIDLPEGEAIDCTVETLREIGDYARHRPVTAVVETHDAFVDSLKLFTRVRRVSHLSVRILWDVHHPYRIAGESVQQTLHNLDGLAGYTHIKNSVLNDDGEHFTYVLTGQGDVPLREIIHCLKDDGYDGCLTLEWEKRWIPVLDPAAIAFPHYIA